uniref:uncharacterized protein tasor2 isoform X2 n=1 Tax=Monopterus albus TaxID=43700 RepID=UPI0009B38DC3|nr:uncharacterized protein LOC109973556 isoform X2 [Monopterus albus]
MESGNGGASSKDVLIPVEDGSDVFKSNILAPLQSAYLYEESKQCFRYKSAVLVKNPVLEEKYNAFRAKKRAVGYSEEDLTETYGFLLFDGLNEARLLGETGVVSGNSTCTTLGDPSKGVYISVYSDCLDLNRWYHGKSGYIAIIRLTKGRVKKVLENYTQNFTTPTGGFDCHVSEELPSVSAKTSSFLAFERTQYYMYELLEDGSNETAESPSATCPFAIVSFSYTDTKATLVVPQEKSEEKKLVCHFLTWKGKLQLGSQFYDVGLRSTSKALITGKLPPVVKVDQVISMCDLRQLLPSAVFETCFHDEVFLNGLYCSLCELVPSEAEETSLFSLLLQEIKDKDIALPLPLNDGGFLFLLPSSHFLTYDDTGSNAAEVLQGMFVFPDTRLVQRDIKCEQKKPAISFEVLQVLPLLSYAEAEAEKMPINPSEELCEVLAQHMQNYATLINPKLTLSPSREVSIFPYQYDVPDAHKHLYSSTEWTNRAWQNVRSYLNKPVSFQLPVSSALEILATGREERSEDLDEDVYICLSSPEEAPASSFNTESKDQLAVQAFPVNIETSLDSRISAEEQVDVTTEPQNIVPVDLQAGHATKDDEKSDLTVLIKADDKGAKDFLSSPVSDDLPAELIVSFTSAERSMTDDSGVATAKHNDFHLSGFSSVKEQATSVSYLNDETVRVTNGDCPEATNLTKIKLRKLSKGSSKGQKRASKACRETPSLQSVRIPVEDDIFMSQNDGLTKDSSGHSQLRKPLNIDWRKLRRRKRIFGKLSSKHKKMRYAAVGLASDPRQQSSESTVLKELEVGLLRKKTERWDIQPVVSQCGRILVPHGFVDVTDHIKSLKNKLESTKDEQYTEKMLVDASVNTHDTVKLEQKYNTAPKTAVDETEVTTSKDGGDHFQNTVVSYDQSCLLRQSGNGSDSLPSYPDNSEHCSKNDCTGAPPSEAVKGKHTDTFSQGKWATKGQLLLSKLKSVLSRGKRKTDLPRPEGITKDVAQDAEPCVKKSKADSDAEALKSNNAASSVQDTSVGVKEVSKMLSLDPLFAYALGLTPKEKTNGQDTTVRKESSRTKDQIVLDKHPEVIQRPPSIFPKRGRGRGRIKTLKNHQGIPAEYIKEKWWLHFQTPACFATEKLKDKEGTRDNSVSKTVKEQMNSACSSTDALNLLADLALSASNDQVPPQPDPALETSLKKCDLTKAVSSAEQESVLHSLLKQPAARPSQALESPSPSPLVGSSELVGLIFKEHSYSLTPSSSLLLDLPGTPFQVFPLSGSTRLLYYHQQLYGDGIQTLQPSVCQEVSGKRNHRTPEYPEKHMVQRQRFGHCHTFVKKDGTVHVTRQWKENYDFNLDSKFTSDSKDRTIIRALHGPWDFSIEDTDEEVRLIVHMWIGLFYSRSTARFFHVDSNFTHPCSEGSDSLEMPNEVSSTPSQSELMGSSFAPFPSVSDSSKALDLRKKDGSFLDQGSSVLDLSLRSSNSETITSDLQANRIEIPLSSEQKKANDTFNTFKSSLGLQKASEFQCHKTMLYSTEVASNVNDVKHIIITEKTCTPSQNTGCLEHTDVPSCKDDGSFIPSQKQKENATIEPQNVKTTSVTGFVLHGSSQEKVAMKAATENSECTETGLVQKPATDSSKSIMDKETESYKEADKVVQKVELEEIESKDGENSEVKENLSKEWNIEPSPEVITTVDSTKKELSVICNGNCLENKKHVSSQELNVVSPAWSVLAENVNEDMNCCTEHEGKMITGDDHCGKEDGLGERERCISSVEAGSDLSDQPLPMMRDSPDSVKNDCIAYCSHRAHVHEQPPQSNCEEEETYHDFELRKLSANALTDECDISEKNLHTLSLMEPVCREPTTEEIPEILILTDEAHCQKEALSISDESACSLDGSCVDGFIPQTKDRVETGSQNMVMASFSFGVSRDVHEDQETRSVEGREKHSIKEQSHHKSHSLQDKEIKKCEAEETMITESDLKISKTNEGFEKSQGGVMIPSIGIDISGENIVQAHVSHQEGKFEEIFHGQKVIPFIGETTYPDLPTELCSTFQTYSKKTELCAGTLLDASETNKPVILGGECDDRCPTPTIDEKPYVNITQNSTGSCSAPVQDVMSPEQKVCEESTVGCNANPHGGLHPDVELRTLRVLQSISKFLSEANHTDRPNQTETANTKHSLDQNPNPNNSIPICLSPNHTSADLNGKKTSNTKPAIVSASTSQDLHTESSNHFLISPFKRKLEQVLGVGLKLKKTISSVPEHYFERMDKLKEMSVGQDDCHSYASFPPPECSQAVKPKMDQYRHNSTSLSNLNLEPHSCSQHSVMVVKPSNSDESRAQYISEDEQTKISPKSEQIKSSMVTYTTPTSVLLEKTEGFKENCERLNDDQKVASELFSKSSWLSNVNASSKSNSNKGKSTHPEPSYKYQKRKISKSNKTALSSLSMQSFQSAENSSKLVHGNKGFLTYSLVEKDYQTTEENIELHPEDCSDASASVLDYRNKSIMHDSVILGPQSSLVCTIYNTDSKKCFSFLEQVSQRCLQDDLTQASMDQEHLIFSEQMKQLLKRSKRGPICQQDARDKLQLPSSSPMTVNFSSIEDHEELLDFLDAPSLVGQKIKVDMSDRKDLTHTTEEKKALHPQKLTPGTTSPVEQSGVSAVTAECARLYKAMMNDVCAFKTIPYGSKHFRMDRGYQKAESSNHFDFWDQIKREMHESFHSNLNSLVKKSCKTRYRFYILVTSDDAFFEETKAQLEAEGHTAVQPSEFFLSEKGSPLLIILKNEDIAGHIWEIPHLLELKKSPGVHFAGIDQPDDVVNLTHQELFTQGGFIMFDRAALEKLRICNLKKISDILQELSRTGKWKWMLHYRDSRQLKENARLSAEAKEKKQFINWCQDTGILEVLPYHECDLMSKDQPDYLTCLVRLQVQNISARYSVFITDTTDSAFGRNGILTMTVNSFLMNSPSKMFTV